MLKTGHGRFQGLLSAFRSLLHHHSSRSDRLLLFPIARVLAAVLTVFVIFGAATVVLFLSAGQVAAATDPALQWRTIHTDHFSIHYPHTMEKLAGEAVHPAEEAWQVLTKSLGWTPPNKLHLVITDFGDSPNGMASVLPYDRINAFAVAPDSGSTLGYFDDWLRLLIYHELTHILQINSIGGLPQTFNQLFGKTVLPNATLPRWFIEGLATCHESMHTGYGRLYSSSTDMMVRMAILDGVLPGLDKLSATPDQWPRGHSHYLFGARFNGYLYKRYGDEAMARFIALYGKQVVPYGLNKLSRRVFGRDMLSLWEEWYEAEKTRVDAIRLDLAEQGITPIRRLTRTDGISFSPRISPLGDRIVWYEESAGREARLIIAQLPEEKGGGGMGRLEGGGGDMGEGGSGSRGGVGEGAGQLAWGKFRVSTLANLPTGGGSPAFSPDGQSVYFWAPTSHKTFYRYGDIYKVNLKGSGKKGAVGSDPTRLTHGARARDLDVSPVDGRIVWVANVPGGSVLRMAGPDMDRVVQLEVAGIRQFDTPRWSPVHGGRLAVSAIFDDRMRELAIIDLPSDGAGAGTSAHEANQGGSITMVPIAEQGVTRLTNSQSMEVSPSWLPDGSGLLFASDHDGIYNIYTVNSETKQFKRRTRLVGGAFHSELLPTCPRNSAGTDYSNCPILFSGYFSDGYDLALANPAWLKGSESACSKGDNSEEPSTRVDGMADVNCAHGGSIHLKESLFQIVAMPKIAVKEELGDATTAHRDEQTRPPQTTKSAPVAHAELTWESTAELAGEAATSSSGVESTQLPWPSVRYNPISSMGPRAWIPVLDVNPFGQSIGLLLQGEDAASRHHWTGTGDIGLYYPVILQGAMRYSYGGLGLDLALSGGRSVISRGNVLYVGGQRHPYFEDSVNLGFEVGRPFYKGMRSFHYVNLRVDGRRYTTFFKDWPAQDPFARKPIYPSTGYGGAVSASWTFSDVIAFASSISPEKGKTFALSARYHQPLLEHSFHGVDLSWWLKGYVPVPIAGLQGHVLMGSLLGGVSMGDKETGLSRYVIGGPPSMDLVQSVLDGTFLGGGYLRGFPPAFLYGTSYHVATGEYRFPLLTVDKAPATLPLQLGKIHGAFFADSGTANSEEEGIFSMKHLSMGIGGEIRTSITIGYSFPLLLRTGLARGLGPDGVWDWYLFLGRLP